MKNSLIMYLTEGITYLFSGLPLSILIYCLIITVLQISNRRKHFTYTKMIIEFIFILYIVSILKITGIIGMKFNFQWFKNSLSFLSVSLQLSNASLMMLMLNMLLFIPLGVFLPVIFKKANWNAIKITLIGISFSFIIEFLQMFGGRMSELDDIIANSLGTFIGYFIFMTYKKSYSHI